MRRCRRSAAIRFWVIPLALVAAGCRSDLISGLVPAPGAKATVVFTEVAWTGGTGTRMVTVIDSASGEYLISSCQETPGGPACEASTVVARGPVLPFARERVFTEARTRAFRALRARYERPAGVSEPDFISWTVVVTMNSRRQTVYWEAGAPPQPVLQEYVCLLLAARGELLLCD